ncbi:response regulator [Aeromicrobium sp. SMF47]|uniref:Response regulator n=1 Tax=Aeromicrobium yanjiei TaxID=2662028 RepID=A0A5Q2MGU7_9ACTN|nr:response regulator transcription factor [Aeromicrobium yanjiei]MRJ76457.1 response regulator [Aeromicrobium yanjiei]QGG42374.1 response regulator [Aeromicrobium yanjiei]
MNAEKIAVIIEDDADVRHLLKTVLTQSGFQTIMTTNGADGIEAVRLHDPVLTTLDVSMPGMDGFAAAKRIREFSNTYLVMLTALSDEIDIVQGLDSGADDYLLKPFRPRELRARIETMMRRPRERAGVTSPAEAPVQADRIRVPAASEPFVPASAPEPVFSAAPPAPLPQVQPAVQVQQAAQMQQAAQVQLPPAAAVAHAAPVRISGHALSAEAPVPSSDGWLEHRGLRLNTSTRMTEVDGRSVDLTRSEFDLLAALLSTGRRVRSKADLVLMLRGESYVTTYYVNDADKRAVEVHLANLRRKIGDSSSTPRFIETVRGVGYRLASDRDPV